MDDADAVIVTTSSLHHCLIVVYVVCFRVLVVRPLFAAEMALLKMRCFSEKSHFLSVSVVLDHQVVFNTIPATIFQIQV
jgi:hypothetical protein